MNVAVAESVQSTNHIVEHEDVAARCAATTLITASTATDVERLARRIHAAGSRSALSFVQASAAALPVEPRAFLETCAGLIEAAAGGTLLLTGVEEMPAFAQGRFFETLAELRRPQSVSCGSAHSWDNGIPARVHRQRRILGAPVLPFERHSRRWQGCSCKFRKLGLIEYNGGSSALQEIDSAYLAESCRSFARCSIRHCWLMVSSSGTPTRWRHDAMRKRTIIAPPVRSMPMPTAVTATAQTRRSGPRGLASPSAARPSMHWSARPCP